MRNSPSSSSRFSADGVNGLFLAMIINAMSEVLSEDHEERKLALWFFSSDLYTAIAAHLGHGSLPKRIDCTSNPFAEPWVPRKQVHCRKCHGLYIVRPNVPHFCADCVVLLDSES
jgi:hypothetical protein